ncbi:MAG TPA: hypothetical protein VKQ08_05825 [Cyclobacteriaceae bacterium]|nr:hypothetical protein [Cyclobacteriaceae bacterium]
MKRIVTEPVRVKGMDNPYTYCIRPVPKEGTDHMAMMYRTGAGWCRMAVVVAG